MLAGLTGQPGSHNLAVTRRSWSSPGNSAALTASLSKFSPGQMKCSPDFRLVASLYGLRRTDNHPGLSASSPSLNLPSTRISLAASARQKVCSRPKARTAGTASSFATLRRLAPVEAFDRQPHPATSACALFGIAVSLSGHRSPFLASPALFPMPGRMLFTSTAPALQRLRLPKTWMR
jgi:hypothetical protein